MDAGKTQQCLLSLSLSLSICIFISIYLCVSHTRFKKRGKTQNMPKTQPLHKRSTQIICNTKQQHAFVSPTSGLCLTHRGVLLLPRHVSVHLHHLQGLFLAIPVFEPQSPFMSQRKRSNNLQKKYSGGSSLFLVKNERNFFHFSRMAAHYQPYRRVCHGLKPGKLKRHIEQSCYACIAFWVDKCRPYDEECHEECI